MKLQLQPDHQEQLAENAVKPMIQTDQEEQPKADAAKSHVQPDLHGQLEEDKLKPLIQPDHQEQPKGNMVIRWIRRITKIG
jgi:hypothetical protein